MFLTIHPIESYDQKTLSLYMMLKLRYKNSTIYNWSYRKISQTTYLSDYMGRKLTKDMIREGLAYEHSGNLCLTSFRNIKKGPIKHISIKYDDRLKDVVFKLRYAIFKYHIIDRQNFVKKAKVDLDFSKKIKNKKTLEKPVFEGICFGYRKLSGLLGVSLMGVKPFLEDLKRLGLISNYYQRLVLCPNAKINMVVNAWKTKTPLNEYYVFKENKIYHHLGTVVIC